MRAFLVDCNWAVWESWSTCEESCGSRDGTGDQTRTRIKEIELLNGGNDCLDTNSETQSCTTECPGNKIPWYCSESR